MTARVIKYIHIGCSRYCTRCCRIILLYNNLLYIYKIDRERVRPAGPEIIYETGRRRRRRR